MTSAKSFSELEFSPRAGLGGVQATTFFPNGYGASVVQGYGTYGNEDGLYELAVLEGDADKWDLTYGTPITDDVEGYLSESDVTDLLRRISDLPRTGQEQPA